MSAYDVQERLGMSPEEFERLYERGVLARNGFDDWSKGWEPAFRTDLEAEGLIQ